MLIIVVWPPYIPADHAPLFAADGSPTLLTPQTVTHAVHAVDNRPWGEDRQYGPALTDAPSPSICPTGVPPAACEGISVMLRNLPCGLCEEALLGLLERVDKDLAKDCWRVYVPGHSSRRGQVGNLGYAFAHFRSAHKVSDISKKIAGYRAWKQDFGIASDKVLDVSMATTQAAWTDHAMTTRRRSRRYVRR